MALLDVVLEEGLTCAHLLKKNAHHILLGSEEIEFDKTLPTVSLLHGYFIGKKSMRGLDDYLTSQGYNALRASYPYWQNLKKIEEILIPQARGLCDKAGRKISLVGHSQGGLVARGIAQKCPELVDKVISLGSPHQGTWIATLNCIVPSARQMMPNSSYLRELNSIPLPPEVEFYCIYTPYDEMVYPAGNAMMPHFQLNVDNIKIKDVGHIGLIGKKVQPLISDLLRM